MFQKDKWQSKKEKNSVMCEELARYAQLQIMKWITPGMTFTEHQKAMVRRANAILLKEQILMQPVTHADLVALVQVS